MADTVLPASEDSPASHTKPLREPIIEEQGELFRKKSLREGVFELLHQRIIAGKYPPGEWLRQEDLSLQLGVSQTPVREALDLLVSVGLAERVPYRGVRVPELASEEIVDAYILRLILESAASRLAALNVSPEELEALNRIVEGMRTMVTLEAMSSLRQLNRQFHRAVVAAAGNPTLVKAYDLAANQFPDWRLYEYMFRHPELLADSLKREHDEHCALVDALRRRDSAAAAAHAVAHIRSLAHELIEYLEIPADLLQEREEQVWDQVGNH
jgi:DNA-binding GntR family transcriptional regulator